jgi:hypothetical protein
MSVLAVPKKGNRVNWGGIEPMIDKAEGGEGLGKIDAFPLANHPRSFIKD